MLEAKYSFEAIGTQWSIDTPTPLSPEVRKQIAGTIDAFTNIYSRFKDTSRVSTLSRMPNVPVAFPESIQELYETYEALYRISGGAVSPLVGESLEQLGYDVTYSLHAKGPAFPAPPLSILKLDAANRVTLSAPALLDVGAIAKGYLIDKIAVIVSQHHDEYIVDGSGDIRVQTMNPQKIGLEDPRDHGRVLGYVNVGLGSLCASATDRRTWGDGVHHIIDARTGQPVTGTIIATWAVADTTLVADALTTGLFFASPESLAAIFGPFNYVMLNKDGSVRHNIESIGDLF